MNGRKPATLINYYFKYKTNYCFEVRKKNLTPYLAVETLAELRNDAFKWALAWKHLGTSLLELVRKEKSGFRSHTVHNATS